MLNRRKNTHTVYIMEVQVARIINNLVTGLRPMIIVNANVQYAEEYMKQVNELYGEGAISNEMKTLLLALLRTYEE